MQKSQLLIISLCVWLLAGCATATTRTTATATGTPTSVPFTLAGGGPCVHLGKTPHAPFANIQVGQDPYPAHSEPMLAENPQNPLQLVGGAKFFTDPAHYTFQIGTYASADGGCTWTTGALLPGVTADVLTSDPTFAFGPHDVAYATVLNHERGLLTFASTDGGKTFGAPVPSIPASSQIIVDKPWMAVDPQSGTISIVTSYSKLHCDATHFSVCPEIAYVRSTDGGKTFSAPRFIEGSSPLCSHLMNANLPADLAHQCLNGVGATPIFGQGGTLAVAYLYVNPDTNAAYQFVTTSADAGQTWSNPVKVAAIHELPTTLPGQKYRVDSLPAFGSDPQTGRLYLTWAEAHGDHADIVLTTTTDFGKTWSLPQRVNDNPVATPVNDSQPQIAVAANGVVSLAFFDSRNDPSGHLLDVYLVQSVDHGASWQPNVRVTSQSWNPDTGAPIDADGAEFIGDYQGLTADTHFVHPFWNDTRTGKQVIFTAAIPSAQLPAG